MIAHDAIAAGADFDRTKCTRQRLASQGVSINLVQRKDMNSQPMKELTEAELMAVAGGGDLYDRFDDFRKILRELPKAYDEAIDSVADMMCRATNKC